MKALPAELLMIIINQVQLDSKRDLLQLRAVNQMFCSLIGPIAFRCIHVDYNGVGAKYLRLIQQSNKLLKLVQEVMFVDPEDAPFGVLLPPFTSS
jgi:hypothetical protein